MQSKLTFLMRITKWAKNICCMFFLKNKAFQHVTEMLKLQTFHGNWTARACNFSKEISDQLWFSYYKKTIIHQASLLISR